MRELRIVDNNRVELSDKSYEWLRKNKGNSYNKYTLIRGDQNEWYFGVHYQVIHVIGKRAFIKTEASKSITFKKNKWYGDSPSCLDVEELTKLLEFFNKDWATNMLNNSSKHKYNIVCLLTRKPILSGVIRGTITSEEGFWKALVKQSRLNISRKAFKKYMLECKGSGVSLYDIVDFSTNPEEMVELIWRLSKENNYEPLALLRDTIESAACLGEKVNPKWSMRRLQEEHDRQNRIQQLHELESMNSENIYGNLREPIVDGFIISDNNLGVLKVKAITSERETYEESLEFSNCFHRCYYSKIQNHNYVAFMVHGDFEKAMVGITIRNGELYIDQIKGVYNKSVSDTFEDACLHIIYNQKGALERMLGYRPKENLTTQRVVDEFDWEAFNV